MLAPKLSTSSPKKPNAGNADLRSLLFKYLNSLKKQSASPATIRNYRSDIWQFVNFSGVYKLPELFSQKNLVKFLKFQKSKNLKNSSITRKLASITQFAIFLEKNKFLNFDITWLKENNLANFLSANLKHQGKPGPVLNQYLDYLKKTNNSPATIRNYRSDILQFVSFIAKTKGDLSLRNLFTQNNLINFLKFQKSKNLKHSSITRKLASITQFAIFLEKNKFLKADLAWLKNNNLDNFLSGKLKKAKKIILPKKPRKQLKLKFKKFSLPQFPSSLLPFLNLFLIILFFLGLGVFAFFQIKRHAPGLSAYPTAVKRPTRQLSFQGRLTDSADNPITTATNFQFKLWDQLSGGTEGSCDGANDCLYTSGTCSITPDQDGIFNTGIGDGTCGSEIDSNIFSENTAVWLEVKVGSETLTPRQPLHTVPYAINAETVQGFPITATESATTNSILVMDESGYVTLGEDGAILRSPTGTFVIQGSTLSLSSDGDLLFSDDNVTNIPLTVSDTEIDSNLGQAIIDAINDVYDITQGSGTTAGFWTQIANLIYPTQYWTDEIAIGGTATSSADIWLGVTGGAVFNEQGNDADFRVEGSGAANALFVQGSDGFVGVGTNSPGAQLDVNSTGLVAKLGDSNHTDQYLEFRSGAYGSRFGYNTGFGTAGGLLIESGYNKPIAFSTGSDNSGVYGANTVQMLIDENGSVGIGDTTPASLFTVGDTDLFQIDSNGEIINLGGVAHSIVDTSGDLVITGNGDLAFDDDTLSSAVDLSVADSGLNASLAQGLVDAINDVYDITQGSGTVAGFWTQTDNLIYPSEYWTDEIAIGGTATSSADIWLGATGAAVFNEQGNDADFRIEGSGQANALFVQGSDGYVGIGTGSPATKLDIYTGSNTQGLRLRGTDDSNEIADFYVGSDGHLVLSTSNTGDSNAYIEVDAEDADYGFVIRDSNTGSSQYANLYMNDAATDYLNIVVNSTNATTGLVVDDDNQVGIGTTTPNALLSFGNNVNAQQLLLYESGNAKYGFGIQAGEMRTFFADNSAQGLTFGTLSSADGSTYSEKMRLNTSGYLGIGDTGPDAALEVLNTTAPQLRLTHTDGVDDVDFSIDSNGDFDINISGDNFVVQNDTDGTTGFQILDQDGGTSIFNVDTTNERVGIGTDSPTSPLSIVSTAGANDHAGLTINTNAGGYAGVKQIYLRQTTNAPAWGVYLDSNPYIADIGRNTGNLTIGTYTSGDIVLNTGSATAMTVKDGGSVGIGDTTPASLFTVGDTDLFQIDSNGEIINLGGVAHSIVDTSGDLVITGNGDLAFDDDTLSSAVDLSVADTGLNALLTQGIIDAINDIYDIASGGGGVSGFWTQTDQLIYPSEYWSDEVAIGGTATASADIWLGATGGAVFNEQGLDSDFRVEGSGAANALFVQGSDGFVGIGTNSPGYQLEIGGGVSGASPTPVLSFSDYYDSSGDPSVSHIDLYAGEYGFGISGGQLNIITQSAQKLAFLDGTNVNMLIDGTGSVGIGDSSPDYLLELYDATNTPEFALSDDDVGHGLTDLAQTDVFSHLTSLSTTNGGAQWTAISDADAQALSIRGVIGNTDPTDSTPAVKILGAKSDGSTGMADLGADETVFQIANNDDAAALTVFGDGDITLSDDLTITGDDLFMATNTANYFLMADGTNYNPTSPADARTGLGLVAGGAGDIWVEKTGDTMTGQLLIDLGSDTEGLVIQGDGSQTANLTEWQNSSGTQMLAVTPLGALDMDVVSTSASTTDAFNLLINHSGTGNVDGLDSIVVGLDENMTFARAIVGTVSVRRTYSDGTSTFSNVIAGDFQASSDTATAARNVSITDSYGLRVNQVLFGGTAGTTTVTDSFGLNIGNQGTSSSPGGGTVNISNAYGLYINNQSGGISSNYAILTNAGNIVFNEGGDADTDFRVEGDTNANLLFLDASGNNIGIGDATPDAFFDVEGGYGGNATMIVDQTNTTGDIFTASDSGTPRFTIQQDGDVDINGDLTITGDDLFMATNTANYFLMADGTNYNPTSPADARTGLGLVAGGAGDIWVEKAGDTMTGALMIDGGADEIQLLVQGNGTQTSSLLVLEDSAGNDQVTISNDGAVVINEEGNDADFRIEGSGAANAFFVQGSDGYVGIGDTTPASLFTVGDTDLFQIDSNGEIINLGGVAHSIVDTSGDLVITGNGDLAFDDDTLSSAVDLSVADTGLNASLAQGIVDAINDVYDIASGGGGESGFWTQSDNLIYPTEYWTDEIAIGGVATASADIWLGVDGAAVFNEQGQDSDFRVEGSGAANALFVQGSDGYVGIGTNAPASQLEIKSDDAAVAVSSNDVTNIAYLGREAAAGSEIDYGKLQLKGAGGGIDVAIFGDGDSYLTGGNLGLGDDSPDYLLELYDSTNTPAFALSDDDIGHGLTDLAQTDVFSHLTSLSTTNGGVQWTGISDADAQALSIRGVIGNTDPTDSTPAVKILGAKSDGSTGMADLGADETVFQIANNDDAAALTVFGDGDITMSDDLTITGDDLFMNTNTANYFLMADGTNYNPTAPAAARTGLGLDAGGAGDIWVEKAGDTMTGQLMIDGGADEIQLLIQGNGTQTSSLLVLEDSAGNDQVTISNDGAIVINEEGNDADFRIEGSGAANALFVQGSDGFVGIGDSGPDSPLEILSTSTQFRISYDDGVDEATFGVDDNGDLTIDASGSQLYLADSDVFNIGGLTGAAYNAISDAGTAGVAAGDNDLYVEDVLEVDGELELDGSLDANGAVVLGDNGDTVTIDSSDWDIDVNGVGTGFDSWTVDNLVIDGNDITASTGNINFLPDNDSDDYIYLDTSSNLSTIYWEGHETNDPGIGINASGVLVYRDNNESSWTTFDSLAGGAGGDSYWQLNSGSLSPFSIEADVNLGATATASAKVSLAGSLIRGQSVAIFNQTEAEDILAASASGVARFRIDNDGYTYSQRFSDMANSDHYLDPAATDISLDVAGDITLDGEIIGDATDSLRLQVGGTTTGVSGDSSVFFLNSSGTVKGRFDTAVTNPDLGDGADGALTPSGTFNMNSSTSGARSYADGVAYRIAPETATTSGTKVKCYETPNGIAAGDEVLLINLQGASGDTTDVGNYEFLEVSSVDSEEITFDTTILNSYDGGTASNQQVVVQRVPNYTNVTLDSSDSITATAWDGLATTPSGAAGYYTGIVALRATGTVTIGSGTDITVNGLGYRKGDIGSQAGASYYSYQGEGYIGVGTTARTANSEGGGGGVSHWTYLPSGGGGGGYGSNGEDGGSNTAGQEGEGGSTYGDSALSQMFLGSGGGGGGNGSSGAATGGDGGNGAGIVFVAAGTLTVTGNIYAQGNDGEDAAGAASYIGGGGGGAGGSVFLTGNTLTLGTSLVDASGGSGGAEKGANSGAGGAGGTGRIYAEFSSAQTGTTTPAGNIVKLNAYGTFYLGATNTSAADVAEHYPSLENLRVAEIVSFDQDNNLHIKKASQAYDQQLAGVISTDPGVVLGEGDAKEYGDHTYPVALAGRIPVLIAPDSEPIKIGDYITSSHIPGYGQKATRAGHVVGKALEPWEPNTGQDRIMLFAQLKYYNPLFDDPDQETSQLGLDQDGNLVALGELNNLINNYNNLETEQASESGQIATNSAILAEQKINIINKLKQLASLSLNKLNLNNLQIFNKVETNMISPLPGEDLIIDLGGDASSSAKLAIINNKQERVLEINQEGDINTLGDIMAQNASISGEIKTSTISATSARLEQLETKLAEFEHIKTQTANIITDATVSGTLYVEDISEFDSKVAQALEQPSLLAKLLGNSNQDNNTASASAQLPEHYTNNPIDQNLADLELDNFDIVLTSTASFIDKYFEVNGDAYIADSLGIGESMVIADGLIDSKQDLEIKPSGGKINILAGLLTLDSNGLVEINGDLKIAGNLQVEDTLLTDLLAPTSFDSPLQVQLASKSGEQVKESRFEIINELGTPVATISAEGKADFAAGIGVGSQDLNLEASSSAELSTDKTSGSANILAGMTEVKIKSSFLSDKSLIYVTPTSSTNNQILYVKSQDQDSFVVGFDGAIDKDVRFNWWVIN